MYIYYPPEVHNSPKSEWSIGIDKGPLGIQRHRSPTMVGLGRTVEASIEMRTQLDVALQVLLAASAALLAVPARADGVAAGTRIDNVAQMSYVIDGVASTAAAETSFVVDQLVNDTVTWQDTAAVAGLGGAVDRALVFKLTNNGNADDSFALALTAIPATAPNFTASNCRLYLDSDGNGVYSSADTPYVAGVGDPALAAGAAADILALCDIPATAPDQGQARVQLTATSKTLSGAPGVAKPGAGVAGVTVVVGASGGAAAAIGSYIADNVKYTVTSAQTVTNPPGVSQPGSGSVIQYTVTVAPSGDATGRNLVLHDPIPDYTTYVPGSLTLDGVSLGDGDSDGDAGDFNITNPGAVTVLLGNVPGDAKPLVITFKVTIN